MLLVGLSTCSTCKKIEKALNQAEVQYSYQDVRKNPPTETQLLEWIEEIGTDNINRLVNYSGQVYRKLQLKDTWATLSVQEKVALLASDGMLIKRPILILDSHEVKIGKEVDQYVQQLLLAQ